MEKIYETIQAELAPFDASLVAVSKVQPAEKIERLYNCGQRVFGENRVQELLQKIPALPDDIQWHLIGQLQTNKVKDIIGKCAMIHAADRLKLVRKINEESAKQHVITPILIQLKIAKEESKAGYAFDDLIAELTQGVWDEFENIRPCGVMGMATFTSDRDQVRQEFTSLKRYFDEIKERFFSDQAEFREISMGMSGDYDIALEEGATLVRIGSKLFGQRNYS